MSIMEKGHFEKPFSKQIVYGCQSGLSNKIPCIPPAQLALKLKKFNLEIRKNDGLECGN